MDNFEKIELIVVGKLKQKKMELERARNKDGDPYGTHPLYVDGLQQEVDTLSQIWCEIQAIKRNDPAVRDEMVQKMYGSL
jgi:hypothetical protein